MSRVLLICMPFGSMTRPAIGISLLKAQLEAIGIPCDIRYLNIYFAELVGAQIYHELSEIYPTSALVGDWIFRQDLFGQDTKRDIAYLKDFLPNSFPGFFAPGHIELIKEYRRLAEPYLDKCMRNIAWEEYGMVGFTTTFQQSVASLALARRIKSHYPDIQIVFGGANCEGDMGHELLRQFPFIDVVFSGEADVTFPALVKMIMDPLESAPANPLRKVVPPQLVDDLDNLPYPDYTDFDQAIEQHGFKGQLGVQYLIEMSRGCWWGQKHKCKFCGLNGEGLFYRSKSGERVFAELVHIKRQYNSELIFATDNILDMDYYCTLFPTMKESGLRFNLFFEAKSNLRKDQLKLMKEVGVKWFQPGIESLNTHVLRIMNKGCTALQNIQLLKWARQYGMLLTWNILIGFPGETQEDYQKMAHYCEAICHLQPPNGTHPFRLDRFSPYFDQAEKYGLSELKPFASYSLIYPFDDAALRNIAYFFSFQYSDRHDPITCAAPMLNAAANWMNPQSFSVLNAIPGENLLVILDSRLNRNKSQLILTGPGREIYLFCDKVRSRQAIYNHMAEKGLNGVWNEEQVNAFLEEMVEKQLMLEEDQHYLSLAVLIEPDTYLGQALDPRLHWTKQENKEPQQN